MNRYQLTVEYYKCELGQVPSRQHEWLMIDAPTAADALVFASVRFTEEQRLRVTDIRCALEDVSPGSKPLPVIPLETRWTP